MHELALCGSIATIVSRHAAGRPVSLVRLRVGRLRQVAPDTLEFCWAMVCESTPLAGAKLAIESVPVLLRCTACGTEQELAEELSFTCPSCGSTAVEVITGEEFSVASIDVGVTDVISGAGAR